MLKHRSLIPLLAWRLLAHSANRFARFVTWVSFLGLALGVMLLTVVVTVMNGFDHELKTRLLSTLPHITVPDELAAQGRLEELRRDTRVAASGHYYRGLGAVTAGSRIFPVSLYGFDANASDGAWSDELQHAQNALTGDPIGIAMGRPLARVLGLQVGDIVSVVTAQANGDSVLPKVLKFRLASTFLLEAEPDYTLVLVNLARFTPAEWRAFGEVGTQIQLHNPLQARQVADELMRLTEQTVTWEQQYGELFRAVQLEKSMMFVLLLLVVAIAAFNIVAGQSMLVNDKRRNIAILRTMGCRRSTIRNTFLVQGVLISVLGTVLGLGLGVLLALNINKILDWGERLSGMHLLDGSFFVTVPVKVLPGDLFWIACISCVLCLLSAWVPARRAAALDPVRSLHG